jgi:hypothetical protein
MQRTGTAVVRLVLITPGKNLTLFRNSLTVDNLHITLATAEKSVSSRCSQGQEPGSTGSSRQKLLTIKPAVTCRTIFKLPRFIYLMAYCLSWMSSF